MRSLITAGSAGPLLWKEHSCCCSLRRTITIKVAGPTVREAQDRYCVSSRTISAEVAGPIVWKTQRHYYRFLSEVRDWVGVYPIPQENKKRDTLRCGCLCLYGRITTVLWPVALFIKDCTKTRSRKGTEGSGSLGCFSCKSSPVVASSGFFLRRVCCREGEPLHGRELLFFL